MHMALPACSHCLWELLAGSAATLPLSFSISDGQAQVENGPSSLLMSQSIRDSWNILSWKHPVQLLALPDIPTTPP